MARDNQKGAPWFPKINAILFMDDWSVGQKDGTRRSLIMMLKSIIWNIYNFTAQDPLSRATFERLYPFAWLAIEDPQKRTSALREFVYDHVERLSRSKVSSEKDAAKALLELSKSLRYEGLLLVIQSSDDTLVVEEPAAALYRICSEYITSDIPVGKEHAFLDLEKAVKTLKKSGLFPKEIAEMVVDQAKAKLAEVNADLEEDDDHTEEVETDGAEKSEPKAAPAPKPTSGFNPETFDFSDPLKGLDPANPLKGVDQKAYPKEAGAILQAMMTKAQERKAPGAEA